MRRIVLAAVVATSVATPAVAEAREYLTFNEARTEVRDIVRTEMKRAGDTYEEGSASIACRRAPPRLKDRASCIATWLITDGTAYCGTARIVEHRTFYAQDLTWQAGTYPVGHQCSSVPRALKPKIGVSFVVVPLSGAVRVKPRGARRYAPLRRAGLVRVGSTVDATRGRVTLITASDARGSTQSGVFDGSAFVVTQERTAPGLTDLSLVGGSNPCGGAASVPLRAGAHQSLSSRVIRRLRGHAHGRFRTRGRYSAATVRGTVWVTEDTCDGTNVADSNGVVDTATGAGQGFTLNPGQSAIFYCFPPGSAFHSPEYCLAVLSQPADGLFAFGLGIRSAAQSYQVCVRSPSGADSCAQFPLSEPNAQGVRLSAVSCTQFEGPGTYVIRWFIGGQQVGVPLPFVATVARQTTPSCIHQP